MGPYRANVRDSGLPTTALGSYANSLEVTTVKESKRPVCEGSNRFGWDGGIR